ncbi:hypothetical protein M758_8G096500 [Ceratodon purpureus]|uniref:Uncharacterized protein n=1 Tax=Ceratodon purpureus TaxID=3225 RepID=A0A8T0GZL7_CERPU|nr:hypothetical protein KC19_8G100800 [Ceratodon purpureus]KAG0608317.1 hypothetical protein M758_8G096500 [Ceratodon purpureus]
MDSFLVSEGEPINDGHRCFGPGCPGCKTPKSRSRITSHPDSTRTPNHYCVGPGCPKCNIARRRSTLRARSALHKCNTKRTASSMIAHICAIQLVSSFEASPLFDGSSRFLNSDVRVAESSYAPQPEPPHKCTTFPCRVCGKGMD